MKNIIRQLLVFFVFVVSLNLAAQTLPVITGQVKCQGRGVANVVVTNGFDCVSTDVAGKYTIPYHRDARFVYVWGIERSGFFNGREKWAKGFENQRV